MTDTSRTKQKERCACVLSFGHADSVAQTICEGIYAMGRTRYRHWYAPRLVKNHAHKKLSFIRVRGDKAQMVDTLSCYTSPHIIGETREELQQFMTALLAHGPMDVFVIGDATALQRVARCVVLARELCKDIRWGAIPCCPVNSVPHVYVSCGFGAAVSWHLEGVNAFVQACARDAHASTVGSIVFHGDTYGWLAAACAAMAEDADALLCLTPMNTRENVKACLPRVVARKGYAVVLISGDDTMRTAYEDMTMRVCAAEGYATREIHVYPGAYAYTIRQSPRDTVFTRAAGRMAVRAMTKASSAHMVVQTMSGTAHTTLAWTYTPLIDALTTRRSIPAHLMNTRTCRPMTALRELLEPCIVRRRARRK